MNDQYNCRQCDGRGSNYGQFCDQCNGTGMASNPVARRYAIWLIIVLNVVVTLVMLKACT